jgi:TonB family protein
MKALLLASLVGVAGALHGQQPDSTADPPRYRGFYPGMTVAEFRANARDLSLELQCEAAAAPATMARCQTPDAETLIEGTGRVTRLGVLAGLDSANREVRYVIVLEADSTPLRDLLFDRTAEWGQPQDYSEQRARWSRGSYGMALATGNGHRAILLGYAEGHGPGLSFVVAEVDAPPRMIACGALQYPPVLRSLGISGRAVLQFVVGVDELVEAGSVKVISTNRPEFGEEAARFVLTCRFIPGKIRQQPVRVLVQQTINFQH